MKLMTNQPQTPVAHPKPMIFVESVCLNLVKQCRVFFLLWDLLKRELNFSLVVVVTVVIFTITRVIIGGFQV